WRELTLRADKDYLAVRERNLHGVEAAARRHTQRNADLASILRDTEDAHSTIIPNWDDGSDLPVSDPATPSVLPSTEEGGFTRVPDTDVNHDQESYKQIEAERNTPTTTTTTRERVFGRLSISVNVGNAEPKSSLAGLFELFE